MQHPAHDELIRSLELSGFITIDREGMEVKHPHDIHHLLEMLLNLERYTHNIRMDVQGEVDTIEKIGTLQEALTNAANELRMYGKTDDDIFQLVAKAEEVN